MIELGLMAALVAGLLGAGHCLTMCGALAAGPGLARSGCASCASWRQTLAPRLTYNAGRIISYALAGAASGTIGGGLGYSAEHLAQLVSAGMPVGLALRAVSAVFLILVGLRLMLRWHWLSWPERAALRLLQRTAPNLLRRLEGRDADATHGRRLLRHGALGLLWGWLPCGQSYSMLLVAAASAKAGTGALIMLAFGVGTLPAMLGVGLAGGVAASLRKTSPLATATGWMLVMLGSLVLASTSAPLLAQSAVRAAQPTLVQPPGARPAGTPFSGPTCHPPPPTAQR